MGNILSNNYDEDESLSITIQLQKSCYYPGETLSGKIILQVKTNKISPKFNFPNAIITLTQYQQYKFYLDNILLTQTDKKILLFERVRFKKYKDRALIVPLSLPFSIKIPHNTDPTLFYEEINFIKHYLTVEFPQIKCKKSIGIIIQNRQRLLKENGLLKNTIEKFNDVQKSEIFGKNSKIAFWFKTDKNSYAYNEHIPYEIIINCTESDHIIDHLRVTLSRNIYFGANDKVEKSIILMKKYILPISSSNKIFKNSGYFQFPDLSDYFSVNPMSIYINFDKKIINNFEKDFSDVYLFPTCFSSLFICSYFLNLEIIFKSLFIKNEILSIPIELYTPLKIADIEKNINDIKTEKENLIINEETPEGYDLNSINNMMSEYTNNIVNKDNDFEIINKEDFYKILTDEKEKNLINP